MKKIIYVLALLGALMMTGCKQKVDEPVPEEIECGCPHTTIVLQPMDNFTQKEAEKLKAELEKHISELGIMVVTDIEILPPMPLNESLRNEAKTRYRADYIIKHVRHLGNKHRTVIALTHRDISLPLRGHKDWGVMGLSLQPGVACVASTYRVKDKSQFWKVAIHEFMHTWYTMPHCPNDDKSCIMKDAKGHENLPLKKRLCKDCKDFINGRQ